MKTQIIDFTKHADKLFNKSFSEIRKAKSRFTLVYGGASSGKSVSVHQSEIINLLNADYDTLFIRKHASDIEDSCYALLVQQAKRFKIYDKFHWVYSNQKRRITCKRTGHKILFRGIDDPEKIKSIVGIKRIIIEEANQLDFEDFRELNRRARGIEDIQIYLVLNPIDEQHWIKKQFVDDDGAYSKDTTVLRYLYKDNKFLTQADIDELERLKLIDINEYNIYVLALWGIRDNKRAWLYNFDKSKHVGKVPFLPTYPVYLSFDFNNQPFACTAWQMSPSKGKTNDFLHCVAEFSGNWKVEEMCTKIKQRFPASILYVCGDRSGQNEDIGRNQTLYQMIAAYLGISTRQLLLHSTNLEHADSQILCNTMLSQYPNLKIDESCSNLIAQCHNAKIDEESKKPGQLLKDRKDHKNDELDSFRYVLQQIFHQFVKDHYLRIINKHKRPIAIN